MEDLPTAQGRKRPLQFPASSWKERRGASCGPLLLASGLRIPGAEGIGTPAHTPLPKEEDPRILGQKGQPCVPWPPALFPPYPSLSPPRSRSKGRQGGRREAPHEPCHEMQNYARQSQSRAEGSRSILTRMKFKWGIIATMTHRHRHSGGGGRKVPRGPLSLLLLHPGVWLPSVPEREGPALS